MDMDALMAAIDRGFKDLHDGLGTEMRTGFENVQKQFEGVDQRLKGIDQRFDGIDQRFDGIDQKFEELKTEVRLTHVRIDRVRHEIALLGENTELTPLGRIARDHAARIAALEEKTK